jgi:hypothetical protein
MGGEAHPCNGDRRNAESKGKFGGMMLKIRLAAAALMAEDGDAAQPRSHAA